MVTVSPPLPFLSPLCCVYDVRPLSVHRTLKLLGLKLQIDPERELFSTATIIMRLILGSDLIPEDGFVRHSNYWDVFLGASWFYLVLEFVSSFSSSHTPLSEITLIILVLI